MKKDFPFNKSRMLLLAFVFLLVALVCALPAMAEEGSVDSGSQGSTTVSSNDSAPSGGYHGASADIGSGDSDSADDSSSDSSSDKDNAGSTATDSGTTDSCSGGAEDSASDDSDGFSDDGDTTEAGNLEGGEPGGDGAEAGDAYAPSFSDAPGEDESGQVGSEGPSPEENGEPQPVLGEETDEHGFEGTEGDGTGDIGVGEDDSEDAPDNPGSDNGGVPDPGSDNSGELDPDQTTPEGGDEPGEGSGGGGLPIGNDAGGPDPDQTTPDEDTPADDGADEDIPVEDGTGEPNPDKGTSEEPGSDEPTEDEGSEETGDTTEGENTLNENLVDPYGTVYDAITKKAIAAAKIILKQLLNEEYVDYDTYTCTDDGTYQFDLATGYYYQITASADDYLPYTWNFHQEDDTEHKIDFYLVLVSTGISSGWCSFDDEVTIVDDIYTNGKDIEIRAPRGKGHGAEKEDEEDPFKSITVSDGVTISTRKLEEGATDYLEGLSGGASGEIIMSAPSITIGEDAKLLAHVEKGSSYEAGDVTLEAIASAGTDVLDLLVANVDHPETKIVIGKGAIIKGKLVKLTAKSDCTNIYVPNETDLIIDENDTEEDIERKLELAGLVDMGKEAFEELIAGLPETVHGALERLNLIAGVAISRATALIDIGEGSLIEAQSFEANSEAIINASANPTAIGVGVAVAIGASDAQVILNGQIITEENCTIKSLADNTMVAVGNSSGIKGLGAGVAVSVLSSKSKVQANNTAKFEVGGDLSLEAKTIDRTYTQASSAIEDDGKVGIAVAVGIEDGVTEAYLGGTADVAGDISVNALMEKDKIENETFFGLLPAVNSGVNAIAGVNTDPSSDVPTDAQKAITKKITDKITGPLMEKVKDAVNKLFKKADDKTGKKTSAFQAAAAVAYYQDTNKVTAGITDNAEVKSGGNIKVHAKAESQPAILSTGAAAAPKDSGAGSGGTGGTGSPGGGGTPTDDGAKFSGAAAVAVGIFTNEVTAYIGKGAAVDAAKDLTVKAEYINDYELEYGIDLIKCLTEDYYNSNEKNISIKNGDLVDVIEGHNDEKGDIGNLYKYLGTEPLNNVDLSKIDYTNSALWEDLGADWKYRATELIKTLAGYLDSDLNLSSTANFWIQSNASGAEVGVSGSVSVINLDNDVKAYIGKNARINQDASYRTGEQNVSVISNLVDEIVYFSGNIVLPGFDFDAKNFKITAHLLDEGTEGDKAAVGASAIVFIQENVSRAEIWDGVVLYADNANVEANTKVLNVVVSAAGGEAGQFGFEGTFTLLDLNNTTVAWISNGARLVVVDNLTVKANDNTYLVNAAGVLAESGNIGVGGTVGLNTVQRSTKAMVGPEETANPEEIGGTGEPISGQITVTDGDIILEALNDGFIVSFSVAGTKVSNDAKPQNGDTKSAPKGGGDYGVGVSANVAINTIQDEVIAAIKMAALDADSMVISSKNYTKVIAVGGTVAIVSKEGTSAALAGSYAQNNINNITKAIIENSEVELTGDLTVEADTSEEIISVSASGSGSTSSNSGSVAGQVSVNIISTLTEASVLNGSALTVNDITVTATEKSSILAISGALAYGGKAGIGTSVAWNQITSADTANPDDSGAVITSIQNSDVNASGDIDLTADSSNNILAVTAAVGAGKEGMALAASVSMNTITVDTHAFIIGKYLIGIDADEAVSINALNNSSILAVAGGLSYAKSASIGVAGSYNEISGTVQAYVGEEDTADEAGNVVERETLVKAGSLAIQALSEASILCISVGGGVSSGQAAVNGSVSINTITNDVSAFIKNATVEVEQAIDMTASDKSQIQSIAGAVGVSKTAAVGAALAINYIGSFAGLNEPQRVVSYIDNSRIVVTQGTLSLLTQSEAIIESISAAGGGGGKAAVYGAVSLNFINTDIASYIKDCSSPDGTLDTEKKLVNVQGDITLIALDKSSVSVIAGNVAGSGTASVGAAIAISYIGNGNLSSFDKYVENDEYTDEEASEADGISESDYDYDDSGFTETSKVRVYIDNSAVTSTEGAILLKAAAENEISNITAGIAAGGKAGVQGSVSVNYLYSNVWVQILNGSTVTADGDIVLEVLSEGSSIRSLAGAVAGGGNAGAGIAIAVNHIANSYLASLEGSQAISNNGDIVLAALNDSAIKTLSASITGGGNLAAAGAVSANFIHNNVSAAVINSIAKSNKTDATIVGGQYPGIRLTAKDSSSVESICGQVNASGTVSIGAAAGYNTVGNTIKAYISDSSAVTSKTYITVKALSEAYIKTVVAGGGIGRVSINGSVAVNSIGNHVRSYIDSSQVTSRKSIALLASDSSEIGAIAGPVGGAYYASVGASVAVNYIGATDNPHLVHAYILNSKVVSQEGGITLYADSDAIVKSISAAGGAAVYAAANGAISVNYVYTSIGTFIKDCTGVTNGVTAFGDITLDAIDRTAVSVIAGSISGAGVGGGGAAVAIVFIGNGVLEGGDPAGNNYKVNNPGQESDSEEFDYNKPTFSDDNKVMAFIDNSFVESEQGSVRITAKANSAIFNISAGAGVGGAAGLQGSVSVNYIYTGVTAYILNGTVEAGGDIVIQALTEKRTSIPKSALQVDSADGDVYGFDGGADDEGDADSLETQPNSPEKLTNIQSIAGAVAGGGGAGLGAAVAVNHVVNTYSAYVFNSTLNAGNDIIIEAHSLAGIETVSAAAAGAGTFAAAGSVSLNFINNTILAYISSSEVTAADNIIIDAEDSSVIKSVSGQINFSGSAGLGAAAAYNEIANTIKAYVDMADATQSVLIAGEDILVRSQAAATISSICASGSFGAYFGGSATVVINMIDNTVSAYIADADVTSQGNLYILAQSLNETNSYGGSIGGGAVGIGAAVIVNIIENDTEAYIVGSSVKALGNGNALTIPFWDADGKKQSDQALNGLIIIAYNKEAITVYSGSAGVGLAGVSGQVSTNIIKNATKAYIDSATINRDGDKGKWVILRAIQDTGIQIYAGSLAAGGTAVGGAVDATYVTNNTSAYLKDSEVYAGSGVDVTAITGLRPLSGTNPAVIIAGGSLSAMLSMAGAVSVVVTENINEAYVLNAKVYSLGSIKVLSSHNILMDIYGGTVAGSIYVGAGGTVVVSSFKNTSRAQIIGSDLNAAGVIELIARSRDLISVKVGTAGVAGVGVAGAVSVILVETTTEASVIKDGARVSLLNQDSRFRPGGTYAPINGQVQTILIKADNKTEVNTLGGALGAGALGIGAAVDYTSIQNRTVAMIGSGSKVYAAGDINLEALSEKVVDSKVYSVGGGLFGVSGAVSIICVGSPISEDGAEEFNDDIKDQINNDMSPNSRLNYKDDSGNTKSRLPEYGIGAKVAQYISGVTGPNVNGFLDPDLNTENKITAAFVQNATMKENRAEIVAGGNVNIHALSKNDLSAQPNNAAAGAATAGGTVAYIFVAENNKAYLGDYGYLRANNTFIKAESFAKAKSHCESAAASVVGGVHAYIAYADIQPVTTAYIGSSADVIVTEKIQIDAEVTPEVAVKVQGINIAGGANVGISKAEAVEKPVVIAYIGDNAKIIAGPQPVSGNPNLTLISRGKLTGAPGLEFKSNTIILDGQFTFKRGVVMSGDPKLTFNKANSTITRDDDGSWLADGFEPDMNIEIIGTWLNDGTYKISAVSEKSLTLTAGSILYDETTGSNSTKDFNGDFTLDDNEDGMLTLIRTDGDTGWTWAEVGLLPGDYLHLGSGEELQSYRITSINGHVLTLDVYTGEIDSVDFTQVSLERIARDLSVKATGDKAQDRVTYNGGSSGKSLEDVFNEGDYFAILIGDMEALGYNSGVYQILGFEDDGFTAILDTMGYVKNNGEESGAAVKEESSEITRKNGSWLDDGFVPGDVIYISGTQHNNGYFEIKEIINDGKTIVLYRGEELTYEKIEPGSTVSIISQGYDRIVRDTGSFGEDGFMAGQTITVDNSDKNNGIYRIKTISADGKALILEVQDVLKREISQNVLITITGDYNAGLSVHAKHLLPVLPNGSPGYTARADAEGISGSILASVNGIYATATVDIIVTSYIGNYADIYVLGDIEVNALNFSRQFAYTTAVNAGGLSISANKAKAASTSNTNAKIGNDVSIRGNDLRITAYGDEENYAQAVAGSGGVISGLAAQAETYFNGGGENHGTNAIVGRNSNINVGLFSLLAEHMLKFNSRVDTTNASIFGASGGLANNTVISDVQALIGEDVVLTAYNIQITAGNRAEKDWLESGLNNVNSGSGGIADFPASRSLTDISFNTEGIIGDGAHLTVIGDLLVPGSLTINTFNELLAKDKVKLAGGGAIAVASAQSIIKADTFEATVTIGEEAKLNSVGDINLSALALADIETKVDVSTWGAASAASGKALSRVKAVNTVTLNEDAYLYAEGAVSLMAGQNSDEQMNKLTAKARVDVDNNGVAPVHTNPSADGEIYLTNYINIKPGALIQSVSDTNFIAQKGPTIAEGKATGHDWIKSAYGAEIKGGTGKLDLISTIRVDGTIQVGLRSQQILIINEDGTINEQESSDGIPVTREKAILAEHILNEINHYKKLAAEYAGTEAGTAFANQAKFLEQELVRMGIDISGDKPLPIIWIDLIIVGDIKAEQSNINVLAEEGSLIGNGVLNASTQPALIKIINNSPHYLVLNSLHIPERDGGLLYYNYDAILGNDLNRTINSKNKAPEANFTISTSASAGSAPSRIHIENSWSGSNPPSIEVRGSIKNVGTQTNPGTVTIQGTGGISTYSSIEAGDLNINAGGSFMQSYTDSLLCVGGVPRAHWGDLAKWFQGSTFPYPYQGEQVWFWSINPYKNHQDWIDSQIDNILNNPDVGAIRADNIFIAARYLNINGLIEAGRPINEVILDENNTKIIKTYKSLIKSGWSTSRNYKDYPIIQNSIGLNLYYDPVQDAIVVDPLAVRGGYVELFGQIISTGSGKITALDGFGRINLDNRTEYDLIIKGFDTGIGTPGTIIITDTAKKKSDSDNDQTFLVTRYKRQYNATTNLYQTVIDTWYTDKPNVIISHESVAGNTAFYDPVAGYRYEWVMGQKRMKERIVTYRSKSWLGADWLAKDPSNLYEEKTYNIGSPVLMPDGEYLSYRPDKVDENYLYWHQRRSSGSEILWGYRNWSEQSWFLAPKYYYEEYTYRQGYIDVYYHSIKADYSIDIEFSGERGGFLGITSKGSIIIDGVVKNESGDTNFKTDGSIKYNTGTPITTRNLTLEAGTGIGGNLPVYIALIDGVLNAKTTSGDINIKETLGHLILGEIIATNANVKLESKNGIFAQDASSSLIKGKTIELLTASGSIQGEQNSPHKSLRIDTGEGDGSGLIAKATSNINLEETDGDLRVISVICSSGTSFGDVTIKVSNGNLINPNKGEYKDNVELIGHWNSNMSDGDYTAAKIATYLEEAQLKRIIDTAFMTYMPNITAGNINLDVLGNVGGADEITLKFIDGKVQLSDELIATLTASEYGAVSFYDESGNKIDPTVSGSSVAYLKINVPKSLALNAKGTVNVNAGGSVYLESEEDIALNTVSSRNRDTVRVRSSKSIINAGGETAINIRGGDIVLEASGGPIGANNAMLTLQQASGKYLDARSAYDINLQAVAGSYGGYDYSGGIGIGFIYSPTNVNLQSVSGIIDAKNDSLENIVAQSLTMVARSIGTDTNLLELDLAADGVLNALATAGGIYLEELAGNINAGAITTTSGDVVLKAQGSILDAQEETADNLLTNITGSNITLIAVTGGIGAANNFLEIDSAAKSGFAGSVNAQSPGSIYLDEVTGDMTLDKVTSNDSVYLASAGAIISGTENRPYVEAMRLWFDAATGVGTETTPLLTTISYLEGNAGTGPVWLTNAGALTIGGIETDTEGITAGGPVQLRVANTISGSITVAENIASSGEVVLTVPDTAGTGEDITVNTGVKVQSGGPVTFQAGDNIYLTDGAAIEADGLVTLIGDFGNADIDVGTHIEINGVISGQAILIEGNSDNDIFDLVTPAITCPVKVYGFAGDDKFNLIVGASGVGTLENSPIDMYGGDGSDSFYIKELPSLTTKTDGVRDTVTLDGGNGPDIYTIDINGAADCHYIINIVETGKDIPDLENGNGLDSIFINGTEEPDTFLLRQEFIAVLHSAAEGSDVDFTDHFERINYDSRIEMLNISSLGGNDRFYLDDNSAVTTIDAGEGDDFFQVGQMFGSRRDAEANIALGDEFTTVHTTRGYLSAGTSYYTTLLGGEGHDMFSVYSNLAELRMEGQDGNDKFVLRAFALADPDDPTQALMNVDAGSGDDYIEYNINAKVNINGGDGFDRVVAIGSEFDDVFIITRDGITGAGLNIVIEGAEECFEAYGMEGNDTFYIQSTREGTITILAGGLGSDEFIVMGDVTKAIATSGAVTYIVPHDLDSIMGPLIIEGDNYEGGAQFTVFAGVGLPYEDSGVVEKEIVPVDESNTKDKMYVYNDGSTVGETGLLTENNLSGLGMCEGFIVNEGTAENPLWVTYFGGITYGNLEVIEILLGSGNDDFTVQDTAEGAITAVHGGGGNDTITIKVNSGPLVVYGDTSEDGNRYSKTVGDGPLASGNSFDNPGDDTIHAGASTYGVIIYGGGGNDIITGSQGADYLAGGSGNDTIYGEDGADIIFGDSGFNVDLIDWMIQVPTTEAVGADTIYGGEGNNIIFGDHGRITQTDLPAGTLSIVPKEILVIEGINVFNNDPDSGSDTIYGAAGSDIIFGGGGSDTIEANEGDNIVFGDFGKVTLSSGVITQIETTAPEYGGNDTITTGTGDDIILGGAGSDTIYAGDGHDLVLGDSGWVAFADGSIEKVETIDVNYGGDDLIIGGPGDDILIGGSGSDIMDGNEGMDLIIGDNAALELSAAGAVPGSNVTYTRFRVITGATIYDRDGNVQIGTVPQYYPGTAPVWAEFMITLNNEGNPGDDYLAGGAGNDMIFGQKGNDVIQGDGSIRGMRDGNPVFAARNPDGTLNLNPSFDADTDGDDYIEGGGGNDIIFGNLGQDDIIGGSSNLFGLNTPDLREDGSDFIFGGSGTDIDRNTVGDEFAAGHARDADFILGDNGNIYRLVNSAGQYLTFNYDNYRTRETERIIPRVVTLLDYTPGGPVYNSSAAGNLGAGDEIHGEAGDDVIYGMTGDDILFGEGQDDDLIGGWGNDWISAGTGIDGVIGDDGWIYTNRIGTGEPLYGIKSSFDGKFSDSGLVNRPYERGQIYKTLVLDLVNESRRHDKHFDPLHADDIIYGGLGNDFLNGGAGDDAISGTEALPKYYSVPVPLMAGKIWPYVGGGFYVFDPFNPSEEIEFILDYDETEIDGDDIIWGSFGDDWLVGAAGNDLLFGGSGNDVINAYDSPRRVVSSTGKQTWDYYDDVAYGGDGSDYLIGNKGDCLVFNRLVNRTYLINNHASHLFNGRMLVHFFPGQGRTFILLPEETHYGDYFKLHSLSDGSGGYGGGGGNIKPDNQEPQPQPLPVPELEPEPEEPGGAVVELQFESMHQLLLRTTLWKLLLNGWKLPVSFVPEEISAWLWFGWMQL